MANTTAVYARIDTGLKKDAESILMKLGITPSSAIQMFYSQIILQGGMPFELRIPNVKPVAIGNMSREQLNAELAKGIESLGKGKPITADQLDIELHEEFGI